MKSEKKSDSDITLLVLAGGFGTRLKPALPGIPKALAPIADIPFLGLQIENWIAQGITSFVFLLHHQADLVQKYLESERNGLMQGCTFTCLVESSPLGTGGAIVNAVRRLGLQGKFFVANADTWLGSGIPELSLADAPAIAVVEVQDSGRYGNVVFSRDGVVRRFNEKDKSIKNGWINAGLMLFSSDLFFQEKEDSFSLETHSFPLWVEQGVLNAVPIKCNFVDIGIPDDYYRFCYWQESGRKGLL